MRRLVRVTFVAIMLVTLVFGRVCTLAQEEDTEAMVEPVDSELQDGDLDQKLDSSSVDPFLLGFRGRLLSSHKTKPRANLTCDKYPTICHAKGSPGHHCCKKKCVNFRADNLNCGKCGLRCKNHEICCKGKCVNTLRDKKNCGKCGNKCKNGRTCDYGMCSYA